MFVDIYMMLGRPVHISKRTKGRTRRRKDPILGYPVSCFRALEALQVELLSVRVALNRLDMAVDSCSKIVADII